MVFVGGSERRKEVGDWAALYVVIGGGVLCEYQQQRAGEWNVDGGTATAVPFHLLLSSSVLLLQNPRRREQKKLFQS